MTALNALALAAHDAAARGDFTRSRTLWRQVRDTDPAHREARFALAFMARSARDFAAALEETNALRALAPDDVNAALLHAQILREAGADPAAEAGAIAAALAINAYCWPALLQRGQLEERIGRPTDAAITYRHVLRIAPPAGHRPPDSEAALAHAERLAADYGAALEASLLSALSDFGALPAKWREAVAIMAGRTKPYHADCNQLTVPRLPAQPFFDRSQFAWAGAVEAATDAIRKEMRACLVDEPGAFTPYIQYRPGDPVNQWTELNHSKRWSTFHLWRDGAPVEAHLARCPATAAALANAEMAAIDGLCPNAMFSVLAAHTEIPPHHGETNARLVAHLPLIVPEKCTYRVGYDQRQWREGELLIFDDTLEHTARNDSDHLRVVLIFDVWNPYLSTEEREIVRRMTIAGRAFHAAG